MSATQVLLTERAALCDTFEKFGPDAPTLCEGWNTLDLAAHLVAREARRRRDRFGRSRARRPPPEGHGPVQGEGLRPSRRMLRTGPPWMHRTGPLATANVNENFVHHEDVRRPAGETPRRLDPEMDQILWKMLGFGARMSRKAIRGAALTLRTPDGREKVVTTEGAPVVMTGETGELILFMSGRKDAAVVTHEGSDEAVGILLAADLGT